MKKINAAIGAGIASLMFTACGDDVTKVTEVSNTFESVASLEDATCTADDEGSMVFARDVAKMYACTDSEWVAINGSDAIAVRCSTKPTKDSSGIDIYCDGDKIGTVYNGKDGATGKKGDTGKTGAAGKDGNDGDDGKDGADGDDGKDGANGTDGKNGLGCSIKGQSSNLEKSVIEVTVSCGEDENVLEIPTDGLTTGETYTRKVALRIPANDIIQVSYTGIPTATVTVYELDKSFNTTGKTFNFEIPIDMKWSSLGEVAEFIGEKVILTRLSFEGEISISNLKSSNVLVQVDLDLNRFAGEWNFDELYGKVISYQAYADLKDTSLLTVTQFTDIKKGRVQALVAGGKTFAEATKQANDEFFDAFGFPKKDYLLENDPMEIITQEDYLLLTLFWGIAPMIAEESNVHTFNDLLIKNFAKTGTFNDPMTLNFNYLNNEKTFRFIDILSSSLDNEEIAAFAQQFLINSYKLPECNAKFAKQDTTIAAPEEGEIKQFTCLVKKNLWIVPDTTDLDLGKCDKTNLWTVKELNNSYQARCEVSSDDYYWNTLNTLEYPLGFCQNDKDTTTYAFEEYVEDSKTRRYYYACNDHQWTATIGAFYYYGECNANTKDTLYSVDNTYDYICQTTKSATGTTYEWVDVTYDFETLPKYELGACNAEKYGKVFPFQFSDPDFGRASTDYAICDSTDGEADSFEWRVTGNSYERILGFCNEDVEKEFKIFDITYGDYLASKTFNTVAEKVKCTNSLNNGYMWKEADEMDIALDSACVLKNAADTKAKALAAGATIEYNNTTFVCANDVAISGTPSQWVKVTTGNTTCDETIVNKTLKDGESTYTCTAEEVEGAEEGETDMVYKWEVNEK